MLQVNYAHLPASLRCCWGQPSPVSGHQGRTWDAPGRGPPTLGGRACQSRRKIGGGGASFILIPQPPYQRQGNERKQCGSSVASGGLRTPCPRCPRCRGQSLLSLSFPWPPLPPHLPYLDLGLMLESAGPEKVGPDTGDRNGAPLQTSRQGSVLGSSEHGDHPPDGETLPTLLPAEDHVKGGKGGPAWRGSSSVQSCLAAGTGTLRSHHHQEEDPGPRKPRPIGPSPAQSTAAPGSRHETTQWETRRDSTVGTARRQETAAVGWRGEGGVLKSRPSPPATNPGHGHRLWQAGTSAQHTYSSLNLDVLTIIPTSQMTKPRLREASWPRLPAEAASW